MRMHAFAFIDRERPESAPEFREQVSKRLPSFISDVCAVYPCAVSFKDDTSTNDAALACVKLSTGQKMSNARNEADVSI